MKSYQNEEELKEQELRRLNATESTVYRRLSSLLEDVNPELSALFNLCATSIDANDSHELFKALMRIRHYVK